MRNALIGTALAIATTTDYALPASAQQVPPGFEAVGIAVDGPRTTTIKAYLRRPAGATPRVPAVVALHGCGGLFSPRGTLAKRETDWAERLSAEGYAVLLPDSFNPRGYRQVCTVAGEERAIHPAQRAYDALAAADWLGQQPFIDPSRLALMGWSNGGSTVLATIDASRKGRAAPPFRTAIAFYPGCRISAERATYAPSVPLTILIGSADDWTSPEPCRALAARLPIRLIEYPGAVHDFDAPNAPQRTRTGVGVSSGGNGTVQVGTDPAAREAALAEVQRILAAAFGKLTGDR
jgi:dienelactone hydrolase